MKLKGLILFLIFFQIASGSPIEDTEFSGFLEGSIGLPFSSKEYQNEDFNLAEARVQLEAGTILSDEAESKIKIDLYRDEVLNDWKLRLREGYVIYYPSYSFEIKAGRQILTWGSGDLVFINDRFPKDYESFYSGRDIEYLKLPSDAVKISFFPKDYIVDLVFTPFFTPNRVVNGERLTFFNQSNGDLVKTGRDYLSADEPPTSVDNTQVAARIKKTIDGHELALYGYRGFYLDPNPNNSGTGYEYSRNNVLGGSWIGNFLGGIANTEVGYEDSQDDRDGKDPNITNSYMKLLLGYKRELSTDLTLGLQYLFEHMMDYGSYRDSLPDEVKDYAEHENRSMFSLRLTKLLMQQKLRCELFTFYSPTDRDGYVNPNLSYDWSDDLNTAFGMNIFYGKYDHTDFGQLKDNTNIYLRARYYF